MQSQYRLYPIPHGKSIELIVVSIVRKQLLLPPGISCVGKDFFQKAISLEPRLLTGWPMINFNRSIYLCLMALAAHWTSLTALGSVYNHLRSEEHTSEFQS